MQSGPDLPFPITNNPILGALIGTQSSAEESEEMMAYREQMRESELRLLGTMLFQALMLGLCILLYAKWTWSHFNNSYESAIFYGFAGFSVQAAFYFVYRAIFEDSSTHRRNLRKMRMKNRQRMSQMKYQVEKAQQEAVLNQQMKEFQNMMNVAMSDNKITTTESNDLMDKMKVLQELMNATQTPKESGLGGTPSGGVQQVASVPTIPREQMSIPGQSQGTLTPQGAKGHVHNQQ
jgi:hypothetical protein